MNYRNIIKVEAQNPPVVEMDTTIRAAYVRFSTKRVVETKVVTEAKCTVTIDTDSNGDVVGIELVGIKEFQINGLLKMAGVTVAKPMLQGTRYNPAKLQAA